ncbi:MAG: hypothetical protein ACLUIF_09370 [Roseburia sp.]
MEDFVSLINSIYKDKEQFPRLIELMNPLINKYARTLYKDEKEDVRSELILALWESVSKLNYIENEGQCVLFITNALKNKFYELYRNSKKIHDNQFASEIEKFSVIAYEERDYENLILRYDLKKYLKKYNGLRYQIYNSIIFENLSICEIAEKYNITRQYVNRLKNELYLELKNKYFKK